MDADWEIEIGGGAPVIEAQWPGFVDLQAHPERIRDIAEAVSFPPLAQLLLAINAPGALFWTSKCDLWEPEPLTIACYVDVFPRASSVFANWHEAEIFCRECVARLREAAARPSGGLSAASPASNQEPEIAINLVVRTAIAGEHEGFGITAYLSAHAGEPGSARAGLASAINVLADALLAGSAPPDAVQL